MIAVIHTQDYENYGDVANPHWKAKGGREIKVLNVPSEVKLHSVAALAHVYFDEDGEMYRAHVIDVSFEADDYKSWFEKSQMEYDGTITYPEPTVEYSSLANSKYIEMEADASYDATA